MKMKSCPLRLSIPSYKISKAESVGDSTSDSLHFCHRPLERRLQFSVCLIYTIYYFLFPLSVTETSVNFYTLSQHIDI